MPAGGPAGRAPAPRQPRRAGRRPRQRPPPRRPRRARGARSTSRLSASTRCSTAATRRRARPSGSSPTSSGGWPRRIPTPGSRRSAAATTRWTATSAGTASSAATTRSSTGWGSARRARSRRSRRPTTAARTTSSSRRRSSTASTASVRDGDPIVHANFRADRARQLTHALADPVFDGFDRAAPDGRPAPRDLLVVTMTEYEAGLPVEVAFPPEEARSLAAGVLARPAGASSTWPRPRSTRTSRTSSTAAVEAPFPGEERLLIPSPKVATYDLAAGDERGRRDRRAGRGHRVGRATTSSSPTTRTRTWSATRASGTRRSPASRSSTPASARIVAAVDAVDAADPAGPGALLAITADHGNADELRDAEGRPVTAHSLNPVPFVLVGRVAPRPHARATASWPTSRRPCSSWRACRAGRG